MPPNPKVKITFPTKEALDQIGRSKAAVFGWIRKKLIDDVGRNRKNERVWTMDDIARFKEFGEEQIKNRGKRREDA